jgi:hypothetical protein
MSYCVECGVKLAEYEKECPLCTTPVYNPNEIKNFSTPSGGFPVMSDPIPETPIEKEPSAEEKANLRLLINKLGL